jgi:cytochrome c-type biogenesis protein CcmI
VSLEGLLFTIILIGMVALWVFYPLFTAGKSKATTDSQTRERLLTLYEQTLRNIRDLDDDHATGKISTEDYQREREDATQRGIALLKALDSLEAQGIMTPDAQKDVAMDDAIEAAVAKYRAQQ